MPGAEAAVRRDGFDPSRIASIYHALPTGVRAGFRRDPVPDSSVEPYLAALREAGIKPETDSHGQHLGMLAALLSVIADAKREFREN